MPYSFVTNLKLKSNLVEIRNKISAPNFNEINWMILIDVLRSLFYYVQQVIIYIVNQGVSLHNDDLTVFSRER